MSQIQQFYTGQNIFITGGTGFLGKILTEKLIRGCPNIGTIYLLLRGKNGKTAQERIDALLTDSVFDVLRHDHPDFSKKIVGVTGDIAEEGLGLSTTDLARLVNEVSVIFHLAATVRFNEKLDTAVAVNVNSVKYIVDIAKACKNLKVGIYVSTAYSHCIRKSINEELYSPPLSYEGVNKLIEDIRENKSKRTEEEIQTFKDGLLGEWPNTYTFTKAIAESVITDFAKEMPFAVFRPSIVMNAYREPIPGWVSGITGFPALIWGSGLGILRTILVDNTKRVDIVPVDYVCNALISSAWETAVTKRRPHEQIPTYNYVSGSENPVTYQQVSDRIETFGRIYPTNAAVYYPSTVWTVSKRLFAILELFFHLIPALIADNVARLFGKNLGLYKVARKVGVASRTLAYFSTQQWDFENQRIQNLWNRTGTIDRLIFPFNIKDVDWDEHSIKMIKGIRKYIFGDTDDNLEEARQRHVYLYVVHVIVRLIFGTFVLWIIWKLFCVCNFTIGTEALGM